MPLTGTVQSITPGRAFNGTFPRARHTPEAATQTYKVGNGLKLDASGRLTIALIGDVLKGFSAKDGQNLSVAGEKKGAYFENVPGTEFEGTLDGVGPAVVNGVAVGFKVDATSGKWVLDTAAAVKSYQLKEYVAPFAAGDTNARVLFEPLDAANSD
jgi:hypothetical protein